MSINPGWILRFNREQSFTGPEYRSYALAIGQASMAWNYLHEELGVIFTMHVVNAGYDGSDIWYATNFDRPRRALLKAAIQSAQKATHNADIDTRRERYHDEIMWVLAEAERLEDLRNTIFHSPIRYFDEDDERFGLGPGMSADTSKGNPRAKRLLKGALGLSQIRWFRDSATILGRHTHSTYWSYSLIEQSLPSRPKLPNRGHKSGRPSRNRRSHAE